MSILTIPRSQPKPRKHIALLFHGFTGGGMEFAMIRLAAEMAGRGHAVEIVVGSCQGELKDRIPSDVGVIEIGKKSLKKELVSIRACLFRSGMHAWPVVFSRKLQKLQPFSWELARLPAFANYLRRREPDAVLAAEPPFNLIATLARGDSRAATRVVVTEHTLPSRGKWRHAHLRKLLRWGYLGADAVVAVSDRAGDDLSCFAGIPRQGIETIYNPVVGPDVLALAEEPLDHPWFAPDAPPVILAAGRIHPVKDFPTLIRSFARVRTKRKLRLVILGSEGSDCADYVEELRGLPAKLGVDEDVDFPGFVVNPFKFMKHAAVFVLSSACEGLSNVLIEAMACGCPVVSTDCPGGPGEILEDGRYGPLVPVGDDQAMADAIIRTLGQPLETEVLRARGATFSVGKAVDGYLKLLLGHSAVVGSPGGDPVAVTA